MPRKAQHIDAEYMRSMTVADANDCLIWQGRFYGRYGVDKSGGAAHRTAYALVNGPIPKGYIVHHMCRNRSCVNAAHLSALPTHLHRRLHGDKYADELRKKSYSRNNAVAVSA